MLHKVFVDSDVIISSLLSSSGAAYLLLNKIENLKLIISPLSLKELKIVTKRLGINEDKLDLLIQERFSMIPLLGDIKKRIQSFQQYVLDQNDAHIILGAKNVNANFLITYNTRHFKADSINEDLNIIVLTPAMFLQYLRSLTI